MRKEYSLKNLKPKPKTKDQYKESKIATNVRLDVDVVAWLREESEQLGIPYQTLLNSKLKQSMMTSLHQLTITVEQVRSIVKEELEKKSA